jgi:hypothetical protein
MSAWEKRSITVVPSKWTGLQVCACSSLADGTTIGPAGGWLKRIGFPKGSRSAQSVP